MNTSRPAPTLNDVAKLAGVSTATVSRCLNSPDQVIEPTRQKVMEAVRQLGYSPNFGARVMASRRTHTIGAIIPTMENAIFARGLQAFQEELGSHGFSLLVASSSYRQDIEEEQIRSLLSHGAEGLLLIGHDRSPSCNRFLDAQGIPTVIAWASDKDADRPSIGFDNRQAMRNLARKVIALGHRAIAAISAETATNDRARARVQGIRDAMEEAGLDPNSLKLIETPYGIDNGARAFQRLIAEMPNASVVMCGNDVLAVGALRQARDMGLSVPDDISITGFDDIELAQIAVPALTTVRVPHGDMGRAAARALAGLVNGKTEPAALELPTEICMRESLARAGV